MIKNVKPLNVSPTIKATRWILLFSGCFYGIMKKNIYTEYEKKAHVERERKYHEKLLKEAEISRQKAILEIESLGRDFEITDFPPGWEDAL